jgi:FMN reductase
VKIVAVVGNPQTGSRTLAVATGLADRLAGALDAGAACVDLAGAAVDIAEASPRAQELVDEVCGADVVVACSPTYKASYTGLLKAFLDLFPHQALAGRVAVPVMTGASPVHSLAGEIHLRPLLVELGACVPTGSLFFTMDRMPELDAVLDGWVSTNIDVLERYSEPVPKGPSS